MIEIKKLSKIYKPRSKNKTIALDDINISLPDKGFVFFVGKSGSGKTTLLSLIGGLDKATYGSITVNGVDVTKLSHHKLDYYRNNTVGYIFQDYQLIENLTIYENLKMMLDFKNEKSDQKIKDALKQVELEGFENRFPKELSGGQKQRVSIARILVKDPSIILADEPTGNLDLKISKQIMSILKNLAKTKLVLIVSHDMLLANEFGDYIVYIKQGKIISKYKKKDEACSALKFVDNVLYIPMHNTLDLSDKAPLITKINEQKIKEIKQMENTFEKCEFNFKQEEKLSDNEKKLSFFNSLKYGKKFYRGQGSKSLLFSLFIAIILSFISLFTTINIVDEKIQIENNLTTNTPSELALTTRDLSFNSAYPSSIFAKEIDPSYKEVFKKAGYTGNIYEATHTSSFSSLPNTYLGTPHVLLNKYIKGNEDYYKKLFGKNGELVFLDKNDVQYEDGIYVSDVYAYLFSRKYDITKRSTFYSLTKQQNYLINGIIKTDCEERFPNIYKYYVKEFNKEKLELLSNTDEYKLFPTKNEAFYYAGYGMSNTCFISNFNNEDSINFQSASNIFKVDNNSFKLPNIIATPDAYDNLPDLNDDEIVIDVANYNLATKQNISNKFDEFISVSPFIVDFSSYSISDTGYKNPKFNKKLKVVGVVNGQPKVILSKNNKEEIVRKNDTISALYFDDLTQIEAIMNGAKELDLMPIDYLIYTNRVGNRYIATLEEIFIFLISVLILIFVVTLIYYCVHIIRARLFEIGVMKSLGCSDGRLISMFSINLLLTYLKTFIFFNLITVILTNITNKILVTSINKVGSNTIKYPSNYIIIFARPDFMIFMNIVILISFIFAYIIPFLKIRFMKPANIVKAKE